MKTIVLLFLLATPSWAANARHKILSDGLNGAVLPYITLYSTYTQPILNTSIAQHIELNSSSSGEGGFIQLTRSTWSVVDPGVYEFCFSGIYNLTNLPGGQTLEMWGRINGVDVPDSNTRIRIANASDEGTLVMCWVGPLAANDNFTAMTTGSSTNCQWEYVAAGTNPTRPASPSIIMTVKKVSAVH